MWLIDPLAVGGLVAFVVLVLVVQLGHWVRRRRRSQRR
jgi:hypothetical protein